MRISFENLDDSDAATDFKIDMRMVGKAVLGMSMDPQRFVENQLMFQRGIVQGLVNRGYVYNDVNLTFYPSHREVIGMIAAAHGPAGDAATVDKWAAGGFIARFVLDARGGMVEAFK